MSHNSNVLDDTIRHHQTPLRGKCGSHDRCAINHLSKKHPVVRMSALHHQVRRWLRPGVASKDSKCLIGPINFSTQNVPAETPGVAQSLCLSEVHLAPAQRLLSLLAFGSLSSFAQCSLH